MSGSERSIRLRIENFVAPAFSIVLFSISEVVDQNKEVLKLPVASELYVNKKGMAFVYTENIFGAPS